MKIFRLVKRSLDRDYYYAVNSWKIWENIFDTYWHAGMQIGATISFFSMSVIILFLKLFNLNVITYKFISILCVILACIFPFFIYTEKYYKRIESNFKGNKNRTINIFLVYFKLFLSIACLLYVVFKYGTV